MSTAAATPESPDPLTMGEVLRVPVMRRLWAAQIVSSFGDFLAVFAVINLLTFRLHASPQQITGLQISYLLPIATLGVLAGVFVDRWPLKPAMVASDFSRATLCLLLFFAHSTWAFYTILGAISIFSSFFGPAQGVAIRSAVPIHGLRSANALMQQVTFGMQIIGPPLAGVLYTLAGAPACYVGDALSFLLSGSLIASVAVTRATAVKLEAAAEGEAAPERKGLASIVADMRAGISFIVHHAALLFVILALATGIFILGCFGPLIAVYVRDVLHNTTRTYAAASAMIGVGMFGGINVLNTLGKRIPNTTLVYTGLSGIAVGLCVLASVPHVWSLIVGNLIIGAAIAAIVVPANTLIQQETPPDLMGRVGSTTMSLIFSAQILGLLLSGLLASHIGVRHTFALCAVMLVLLIAAGGFFMHPHDTPPHAGAAV